MFSCKIEEAHLSMNETAPRSIVPQHDRQTERGEIDRLILSSLIHRRDKFISIMQFRGRRVASTATGTRHMRATAWKRG